MYRLKVFFILVTVMVLSAGSLNSTRAQSKQFDGVSVNLLTFTGPQIAEPLQRRAPEFKALTGADVTITTVPNSDLYTSIVKDQSSGTHGYQAYVFAPQWMVDFVGPG